MENLDRLTTAGVGIFDLNSEYLSRKDWSQSSLGTRDEWPHTLTTLVNSCLLPVPHPAAIFWGSDLTIVHNLAWGKARGDLDGQGTKAHDSYSEEALSALSVATRGRTIKVAYRFFLSKDADRNRDNQLLLSTLLDFHGNRQGVLAQCIEYAENDKYLPISGLDEFTENNPARQTKDTEAQQAHRQGGKQPVDSRQTQLFHRFAELLPHGLAVVDAEAESIFVNDAFFKLTTNKSKNEFRAWPESIHPDDYDRVMSAYREAFSNREELSIEFRCAADASGEAGEWRLFLFKPLSRDPEAGYICAVIDITEIKQAQITQEKAATEAKDRKEQQERFIDMVSHEIRNPLSAVLHLAEEIKDLTRELSETHKDLHNTTSDILDAADTILLCVSHQNTLVDDILSFSKLDSMMLTLVPREIQPKWGFSTALKVFQSEFKAKHIQFHYAMDISYEENHVDYVVADLNRMKQVLVNLITNAIKFTAKKQGERRIDVSMGASVERPTSYPPNVIFFSESDKSAFHIDSTLTHDWGTGSVLYLMVSVRDTGIGISQENQAKLFGRFRQATPKTQENYGGSGLGLFISRKLCQLHGGDIGVSSKEGEGSTFGFFFKVRTVNKNKDRPSPGSRAASDSSNAGRSSTPAKRPAYSRNNSTLRGIDENSGKTEDRPQYKTLASHEGVTPENVMDTLKSPPTENTDARPSTHKDDRYEETKAVADQIGETPPLFDRTRLTLPDLTRGETARQNSAAEDLSKKQSREHSDERSTLLLVEDNLINQKVLRRQLQSKGFEVFVANNGQEAIDAVAERGTHKPDQDHHKDFFDCILMDQEMPIKDGNAATQEIRELQAQHKAGHSPILGVSANVREAQTSSMMEAGMDAVISKPFKVEDLVKKIRSLMPPVNGEG
ncbi:putative histidine kinase HHK12p [Periconia macrospinosa]|uniref:Putative histidine kinase HHK12p n=1 Tax=Periconia macrospinosa TaxID=97972 RepID=A0A2V1DXG1_9PLEO|nr:putative histidine kinase HHK12p [Periconia macrospinosa]